MKVELTRGLLEQEGERQRVRADESQDVKPVDLRDTVRSGLVARVTKTGMVTFYLDYRSGAGKRRWLKLGRYGPGFGLREARTRAVQVQNAVIDGDDPVAQRKSAREASTRTLGAFIDGPYANQARAELRSAESILKRLRANFFEWWDESISSITTAGVRDWRTSRLAAGVSASTINRDLSALSAVLSAAANTGPPLIPRNPIARTLKPLQVDRHRRCRFLDASEHDRLLEALADRDRRIVEKRARANEWRAARDYPLLPSLGPYGDHLTPVVLLALNTGMRRGEILGLTWRAVDFGNGVITVAGEQDKSGSGGSKSGKTRHIPMTAVARSTLEDWRDQQPRIWPAGLMFPGKGGKRMTTLKTAFTRILKDAGISDFRFHDCRHHFCSMLVQRGVPLAKVRDLAGHSTIQLTERYSHLAPHDLADAIRVLDTPGNVRSL